jgi:ABC-type Fe3+/spermidine/putrescine transport system ATPase subunit
MASLALKSLSHLFGETAVVDRLNLEIASGEFVSLLGASGCGKTTTLRMVAGLIDPSEGTIEMDGKVISSPQRSVASEQRNMSMIFQSYAIWPHMTISENVAFGLKLRRLSKSEITRRVGEVLELVKMGHLMQRYPGELSGGQQQRVALARAVVVRPDVLLLDEPLSNLDAALRHDMRREIRKLHDELRITTLYVTHDQSEAMSTSDRIAVMNGGRIEQVADPCTIYARPATEFVASFIGMTNLLTGRADGQAIVLDGLPLSVPLPRSERSVGRLKLSLRPQDIRLYATQPERETGALVEAEVRERSYLGESWVYVIAPSGGGPLLSVTTPPQTMLAAGDQVWAALELARATVLRS